MKIEAHIIAQYFVFLRNGINSIKAAIHPLAFVYNMEHKVSLFFPEVSFAWVILLGYIT